MRRTTVFTLLLSSYLATQCVAQGVHKHERQAPETERHDPEARSFMELFTKLEHDCIQAVQKKDKTALDAILAPEFMFRTSENPENSLSRVDWIQQVLTSNEIRSINHHAMVIRAFLGVAVVSFVQSQQATIDGKDRSGDYLIVDVWEVNHDKWQMSARYLAPVNNHVVGATKIQQ